MAKSIISRAGTALVSCFVPTERVRSETGYPQVLRRDLAVAIGQLKVAIGDALDSSPEQRLLQLCESPILQLARDLDYCPVTDENTAEFLLVLPDALACLHGAIALAGQGGRQWLPPSGNALVLIERAQSSLDELAGVSA